MGNFLDPNQSLRYSFFMSLLNLNLENEQKGVLEEFDFETKQENLHMLYHVVRNSLYSDELLALLREYGTNAQDIHIATGQADVPILVTLPTMPDSFLKIRDFGTGLGREGIMDFVSFGESSKRADPNQTGQLGIGCKCGFTYGDSFIVNSYQNGVLTSWNAYIDPSNKGKIAKMAESPTQEANGIEVIIPINASDIDKVHEKAMWFFSFSRITPRFENATEQDLAHLKGYKEAVPAYSGKGWKYMGRGDSYLVMGNIPYPINPKVFTDTELPSEVKSLLNGGIIIDSELGSVDFAASREQLKYTPMTKTTVSTLLANVCTDLLKECSSRFASCSTLWEAKILYKRVFDSSGEFFLLKSVFKGMLSIKGHKIDGDNFSTSDVGVTCKSYFDNLSSLLCREMYSVPARDDVTVVINDGIVNNIPNRLVALAKGISAKTVYLLSFKDDATKAAWFTKSGLDCPVILLSTLPKEPMSKYYPKGASNDYKSPKHSSKEFVFDGVGKSRYSSNRSDFWTINEVDLANDEGVYVALDKFYYRDGGETVHPRYLTDKIASLQSAGLPFPSVIYGFKASSVAEVRANNPKMIEFSEWRRKMFAEYVTAHPEIIQQVADYKYVNNTVKILNRDMFHMVDVVAKMESVRFVGEGHMLAKLDVKVKGLKAPKGQEFIAMLNVASSVGYVFNEVTPSQSIEADYAEAVKRYPILFSVFALAFRACGWEKWLHDLSCYIAMVDATNPMWFGPPASV